MYDKYEKLRDEKGMSDYQIAIETGVSRSTLSDWKTGKHTPNLTNMHTLAKYFGVSIEELLIS